MEAFLVSTLSVAVGELGDKTRFRSARCALALRRSSARSAPRRCSASGSSEEAPYFAAA